MSGTLLTVTGPTCTGKTVLQKLLGNRGFGQIVSFTTRLPRGPEVNGIDYWFVAEGELNSMLNQGQVAEKIKFGNYHYGILGSELTTKLIHGNCVVVVEPNGVKQLSLYCEENNIRHISVFVGNSLPLLIGRFLNRYKEDEKALTIDYANRVINMIKNEQDWIYMHDYDKIFTRFDKENEGLIVEEILKSI